MLNLGVSLNIQHRPDKIDCLIATKNKEVLNRALQRME